MGEDPDGQNMGCRHLISFPIFLFLELLSLFIFFVFVQVTLQ